MNKTFQKLKNWYRGKHVPYTLQEMMDLQRDRFGEPRTKPLTERFEPPLLARIINVIERFLRQHGKWIIEKLVPIILTMIGLYIAYLTLIAPRL